MRTNCQTFQAAFATIQHATSQCAVYKVRNTNLQVLCERFGVAPCGFDGGGGGGRAKRDPKLWQRRPIEQGRRSAQSRKELKNFCFWPITVHRVTKIICLTLIAKMRISRER